MKRFLISLFVGLIGLVSFGNASFDVVSSVGYNIDQTSRTYYNEGDFSCFTLNRCDHYAYNSLMFAMEDYQVYAINLSFVGGTLPSHFSQGMGYCFTDYVIMLTDNGNHCSITMNTYNISSMTSTGCQEEYQLMPISSCNSEFCSSNDLCPSQDFSGFSNLYVNDILFMPSAVYDLTIPEEFEFDYTGNENLLEIDVKGYNTDSEYIAGIISTQGNRPNNEFFNSIITDLIPKFVPGLVIILFIYFIFRFIKKGF